MRRCVTNLWLPAVGLLIGLSPQVFSAERVLNMTPGVTEISGKVYQLHMLIFYICVAIALVVFGAMFYAIFKHRKSKGAVAAHFHESTKVEIIWTIIPIKHKSIQITILI